MKNIVCGICMAVVLSAGVILQPACLAQTGAAQPNAANLPSPTGRRLSGAAGAKDPISGEIRGITRASGGKDPLANAQVTIHIAEINAELTVTSGTDGAFVIDGLAPGHYEMTVSKKGFASLSAIGIDLSARQSLHLDMAVGAALPSSSTNTTAIPEGATDAEKQLMNEIESLKARLTELEARMPGAAPVSAASGASGNGNNTNARNSMNGNSASTNASTGASANTVAAQTQSAAADTAAMPANAAPATAPAAIDGSLPTQSGQNQTKPEKAEPFAFGDFTWLNGNARTKDTPLDTKLFTPEIRADVSYIYDYNHPQDHTIGGSSEVFRSGEFQVTQLGVGGDFHFDNVIARVMTQFGMYSVTTPRNDASPAVGQWDLADAYRYVSEAYGGYHFHALHGINVEAGIFMSYIGLFSYYNFDNWAYQPSYVSSNTPWFFNGMRVQIFPTEHLKIEPWIINGWQSYGKFNHRPGFGAQILWRPNSWLSVLGNEYFLGADTLGDPGRTRYHTDDSIEIKYYDKPGNGLDKMAFSLTGDLGCEQGGGVNCFGDRASGPKQSFIGFMLYDRFWFHRDKFGLTLGGGEINNPGRYLVLLPPINGATAISGTPYFTENPGDQFKAWDATATLDYMPQEYITFRWEFDHRAANVPYFTGPGGITPPGGNQGALGSLVPGWSPDLKKIENRINMALLVKF